MLTIGKLDQKERSIAEIFVFERILDWTFFQANPTISSRNKETVTAETVTNTRNEANKTIDTLRAINFQFPFTMMGFWLFIYTRFLNNHLTIKIQKMVPVSKTERAINPMEAGSTLTG
jgi:hypothetical protein